MKILCFLENWIDGSVDVDSGVKTKYGECSGNCGDLDSPTKECASVCIKAAATVDDSQALEIGVIGAVSKVKDNLDKLNISSSSLDNFAEVSESELETVLGDSMIESVNSFFTIVDKCEAYTVCDNGQSECDEDDVHTELDLPNFVTLSGLPPFNVSLIGIPAAFDGEIFTQINVETRQISLRFRNLSRFDDEENSSINQFFILVSSVSPIDGKRREGAISVAITESPHCIAYREELAAMGTDIFSADYEKEHIQIFFIINPLDLVDWKDRFKQELEAKLSNVFSSISLVERIAFFQFLPIYSEQDTNEMGLGCSLTSDCQAADVQMVIKKQSTIKFNQTLDKSIEDGLAYTKKYMDEIVKKKTPYNRRAQYVVASYPGAVPARTPFIEFARPVLPSHDDSYYALVGMFGFASGFIPIFFMSYYFQDSANWRTTTFSPGPVWSRRINNFFVLFPVF